MKISIFKKDARLSKPIITILIVLYFIILAWVIIFKCNANNQMHIARNQAKSLMERLAFYPIPFQSTFKAFKDGDIMCIIEFFFNIIVFIPFGLLLRFHLNPKYTLISAGLTSLSVEVFQLLSGWGGPDPTDVILNFGGTLIGVYLYRAFRPRLKDRAINFIAVLCSAAALPVSAFAVINTIVNFPAV